MARARAIETRLEKLLPAMEEYFTGGFLSHAETQVVARERSHWEYRLVAKPLLLLDVQNAVAYELGLEKRLAKYCAVTKLVLKHRWAVLERIESIYQIGLKHIKDHGEWELLRGEFVRFLKQHNRHTTLSALYGELMMRYPTRSELWVEAAIYEGVEMSNIDNGRVIVQQAILTAGAQPEVWSAAFLLELHFADRLIRKLVEEKRQAMESRPTDHDPVKELQAENSALACVVVELALVKAVAEEALESPACGWILVQQLLDSAMRFSYTRPLVQTLMAAAATKMVSALSSEGSDGSHKSLSSSAHKWTETAVSRLLSTLLTLDMIMNDHGVTGDPASFLRSGGQLRAATEEERMAARLTSLVAALTLVQLEEGGEEEGALETPPFFVVRRLQCSALAVVETLLEELRQLGYVAGVSALCRCLLTGKRVTVVDVMQFFFEPTTTSSSSLSSLSSLPKRKKKWQKQKQMEIQASSGRLLVALMGEVDKSHVSVRSSKRKRPRCNEAGDVTWKRLWHFLLSEDRAVIETASPRALVCSADASDVERLLLSQHQVRDTELVIHAVLKFLREFRLLRDDDGIGSLHQLRFSGTRTPVALWKVFCLLEERCGACIQRRTGAAVDKDRAGSSSTDDDDDDDDDDDENRRIRVQRDCSLNDASYAAAGLRFLASVPYSSLRHTTEEAERLHGCWALLSARVHTLTQLQSTTRTDFMRCMRKCTAECVKGLRSILRVARLCDPLPRQVYVEIALPFLEALALVQQDKNNNNKNIGSGNGIQEARDAHERLLSMYTLSSNLNCFLPLVRSLPSCEGANADACPAESNAKDWARFVAFERDVAKDLRRAKEVASRARRLALAPQGLLVALNAH